MDIQSQLLLTSRDIFLLKGILKWTNVRGSLLFCFVLKMNSWPDARVLPRNACLNHQNLSETPNCWVNPRKHCGREENSEKKIFFSHQGCLFFWFHFTEVCIISTHLLFETNTSFFSNFREDVPLLSKSKFFSRTSKMYFVLSFLMRESCWHEFFFQKLHENALVTSSLPFQFKKREFRPHLSLGKRISELCWFLVCSNKYCCAFFRHTVFGSHFRAQICVRAPDETSNSSERQIGANEGDDRVTSLAANWFLRCRTEMDLASSFHPNWPRQRQHHFRIPLVWS